jgi:glycosyltransferase involved in cell wall biosynthesis
MAKTLISILTTTRNAESTVGPTFSSIHNQTFTDFEHLVKDAVSEDRTVAEIMKFKDRLSFFESSPDKGIYDGLNLLAQKATGEWAIVIHAGDRFYAQDTLARVAPYLSSDADIVYGAVENIHETGVVQKKLPQPADDLWKGMIGSHQAMFIRTELLRKFPYDLAWRVTADYDFIWKCKQSGARFKRIDEMVAVVSGTGLSSKKIIANTREKNAVALQHDRVITHRLYRIFRLLRLEITERIKTLLPMKVKRKLIEVWSR